MEKNVLKSFSIDDISVVETENSDKYFEVEILPFASGNNSHKNPISEEVLVRDKDSFKGAWVVTDYDKFTKDATTHTAEEDIIGIVPFDSEITTRRGKDGRLWIVVKAVLSKVYHPEVWEMFKQRNFRYVSCEFRCAEGEEDEDGNKPILGYDIVGITILGSGVNPSIDDAQMTVVKFSADEATKYFNDNNDELKKFMELKSNQRKDDEKVAKTKVAEVIEEAKTDSEIIEDNTKQFAEADDKSKKDDTTKEKSTEDDKAEDKKDDAKDDKEFAESDEDSKSDKDKDEDDKSDSEDNDDKTEDKEMAQEDDKSDDADNDVIMSESDEDAKEDEAEDKKFSFDAYADSGALMTLLEAETEENRDFAVGLFSEGNVAVFSKLMALKKENDEFKANAKAVEKENCGKAFAECMSEVKGEIEDEAYNKLFAEGETIESMSDMTVFTQKVKAFAYDARKTATNENDGVFVIGTPISNNNVTNDTDVFERLAHKYQ